MRLEEAEYAIGSLTADSSGDGGQDVCQLGWIVNTTRKRQPGRIGPTFGKRPIAN